MGRKLCELSRLAVKSAYGSKDGSLRCFTLYIYGRVIHKPTTGLEVNPRHAPDLQTHAWLLPDRQMHICPRVNAPAVLLHLELAYVDAQIAKQRRLPRYDGAIPVSLFFFFLQLRGGTADGHDAQAA